MVKKIITFAKIDRLAKNQITLISAGLIIILGFFCYGSSLNGGFIWDDEGLVKNNLYIRSGNNIPKVFTNNLQGDIAGNSPFYRPVPILTYMADYYFWKLDVKGYHLTNVILHIFTALALYWLIMVIWGGPLTALLTAVFFIIHPVNVETVAYISDRADIIAGLFIVLCITFYIKHLQLTTKTSYILTLVSCILAFLSKENSIILPALLLLYHYTFRKKIRFSLFLPLVIINLMYLFTRVVILKSAIADSDWTSTVFNRIPGFFAAIANYIKLLFLPFNLHIEYEKKIFSFIHPGVWAGVLITIFLIAYAFKSRKSKPTVFFSVLWFFLALLPVSNMYPLAFYMAEHWLYLPSIGFFLVLAQGLVYLYRIKKYRIAIGIFTSGLWVFFICLTIKQTGYWNDPITFYKRTLQYAPDSARVHHNLGVVYHNIGKNKEAIDSFKKAIDLNPDFAEAYSNLGVMYKELGRFDEAVSFLIKAIRIKPDYAEGYNNLGIVYRNVHKDEEAIIAYKKAIEINRDYADAYYNLGFIYHKLGEKEKAVDCFEQAIKLNPNFTDAYNNLAAVYNEMGDNLKAMNCLKKAIETNPLDGTLYDNLAIAYVSAGDDQSAVKYYKKAQELGNVNSALREFFRQYNIKE